MCYKIRDDSLTNGKTLIRQVRWDWSDRNSYNLLINWNETTIDRKTDITTLGDRGKTLTGDPKNSLN